MSVGQLDPQDSNVWYLLVLSQFIKMFIKMNLEELKQKDEMKKRQKKDGMIKRLREI